MSGFRVGVRLGRGQMSAMTTFIEGMCPGGKCSAAFGEDACRKARAMDDSAKRFANL